MKMTVLVALLDLALH